MSFRNLRNLGKSLGISVEANEKETISNLTFEEFTQDMTLYGSTPTRE